MATGYGGVPILDFSGGIAGIGDSWAKGITQRRIMDAREGELPRGADGTVDYAGMAQRLLQAGDDQGAQIYNEMQDARDRAAYRNQSLALQKRRLAQSSSAGPGVYGTPIPYQKEDGTMGLGAIRKDGTFQAIDVPGEYSPGAAWQDFGTYRQPFNTKTAQPIGAPIPKAGNVPEGYVPQAGGGYAPGAGTPQEQEMQEAARAREKSQFMRQTQADIVTGDIDRVIALTEEADIPVTGLVGSSAQYVPGTAAHDVSNLLDTIKSNIGFDKLQAMRDASPTGGALGQVSERENTLLQSTYGALAQSQTKEQFLYNLNRLKTVYQDIVHTDKYAPKNTGGNQSGDGWTEIAPGVRIREKR